MKCFNKGCPTYSESSDSNCRTRSTLTIDLCLTSLTEKTGPVCEVPCSDGVSDLVAKWEARIADYEIRIADAAKIGNDDGQWTLSVRQGELMGALRELRQAR